MAGANGSARLYTAHSGGGITVGPPTSFSGERSGIEVSQLDPAVPERLARRIASRAHVSTAKLARFELAAEGELEDWEIYATDGSDRFRAHIEGDALSRVSASGVSRPVSLSAVWVHTLA